MAKLKICGLTCKEDIEAVNGAKPDFAGFIIEVPGRRRSLTAERVKVLVKGLDKEILPVGVFVNAAPELPISLLRDGTLWAAQLHGKPVITAFYIITPEDVQRALRSPADYILLDHGAGGTGEPFDWTLVPPVRRPFFLAGGIGTENIRSAIGTLHPWAVDLSSSLETDGRKDRAKIQQIARMLKQINTLEAYRKEREADFE